MTLHLIRVFFILLSVFVGSELGITAMVGRPQAQLVGGIIGGILGVICIGLEFLFRRVALRGLSAVVFGLLFGLVMARLVQGVFVVFPLNEVSQTIINVILPMLFCYFGMTVALRGRDEFQLIVPYVRFARQDVREELIILDTSVVIDGRVADICQTKFLEGQLVVPRFMLRELQQIADSSDSLKRNRGKRGFDILHRMQKSNEVNIKIHEDDFPDLKEVDAKLIKLARLLNAKILTNDYNLNRLATLEGIRVLNINDLANALRPVVLPGETLEVKLVKEGKEYHQGVGYLDDGTMVVLENAKHLLGQTVKATVTSILQTSAGRMIFAKHD